MSWAQFWDNITTPGTVSEFARYMAGITDELRRELVDILNKDGKEVIEAMPGAIEEVFEVVTTGNLDPINESVPGPAPGGAVYCRMRGVIARSGIYLGDGRIAFLDEFRIVCAEEPSRFVVELGTCKQPRSIFVACIDTSAVGLDEAVERARALIDGVGGNGVSPTNPHQFTIGCLTGDFGNKDASLDDAKRAARECLGADCWRRWNLGDGLQI